MLQISDDVEDDSQHGSESFVVRGDEVLAKQSVDIEQISTYSNQEQHVMSVSDTDSDSSIEADDEHEEDYVNLESHVFKTSNRLFDDILADLTFILTDNMDEELRGGILQLPGIKYSCKLDLLRYNPYELYVSNDVEGSVEHYSSSVNPNDKITVIRGLLFSNEEPTLSKSKVYHFRIAIKTKALTDKSVSKNLFHLCDLSEEDAIDLLTPTTARHDDPEELKQSAPVLIDSASYVCALTKKAIRIEISNPEFDENDLHDYEIGPIKVRQHKVLGALGLPIPESDPSPAQCLYLLFRAMRGPFLDTPSAVVKSIGAQNKSLLTHTNPDLLTRKLHFSLQHDEYFPPSVHDRTERADSLIRESSLRQLLEICFLGTKAYSGGQPNKFANFRFNNGKDVFFRAFEDLASLSHHRFVQKEQLVNLSVYPFYSDDLIKTCYNSVVNSDPKNLPTYYDSLCAIGKLQGNLKLSRFISSLDVIGQKEIDAAYKTLGIDPLQGERVNDELLLSIYQGDSRRDGSIERLRHSLRLLAEARDSGILKRFLKYESMPLSEAYGLFDATDAVDEEMLQTVMDLKLLEYPDQTEHFIRAFVTIALSRGTPELLNAIEVQYPDIIDDMSFADACHNLSLDPLANERQILALYEIAKQRLEPLKARKALRVIGEQKESKLIKSYLESGLIDSNALPADEWPVGLVNTGNTCYLNSLLQYYFVIKPFRDAVLNFYEVYNDGPIIVNKESIEEYQVERSYQFTYHLRKLFHEMIHSKERVITPDVALQFLAFLPSSAKVDFESNEVEQEVNDSNNASTDLIEVDGEKTELSATDVETVDDVSKSTTTTTTSTTSNTDLSTHEAHQSDEHKLKLTEPKNAKISEDEKLITFELGRQQDVTECVTNVQDQIKIALAAESDDDDDDDDDNPGLIKELFISKSVPKIVGPDGKTVKTLKVDVGTSLLVNLAENPRNLYDALESAYMKSEILELEGRMLKRTDTITALPKIMQIQVQRVSYDKNLNQTIKDARQVSFPSTLYMDRFMETDDEKILQLREEVQGWKNEILKLNEQKEVLLRKNNAGMSYKDSLRVTRDWLVEHSLTDKETIDVIDKQIAKMDEILMNIWNETNALESKIDHQFDNYTKLPYHVAALFIHRGTANYGHYWIYIKDMKRKIWRKYNDEDISEVPESEVLNFDVNNECTPYFVAYVRGGSEDLIDPLCRQIDV